MSRYILWDKTSRVITPSGEVFTAEEWNRKYPASQYIDYVMSGSVFNGAMMQEYTTMVDSFRAMGCDFVNCTTQQECLDAIEAFEDAQNALQAQLAQEQEAADAQALSDAQLTQQRIADALEDLTVLMMPDVEE